MSYDRFRNSISGNLAIEKNARPQLNYPEKLYEKIIPKNVFAIKRRLADRLFSAIVRLRDHYTCVRCGHRHSNTSRGLHVSHYFTRSREATRFYWDNVDSLCLACHLLWSKERRADYTAFKKRQLGLFRYEYLAWLAKIANSDFAVVNERIKIAQFRTELAQNGLFYFKGRFIFPQTLAL